MLRIIHIADAHLDTPFYGREEALRKRLRAATRTAFDGAVDVAIARRVDALLIAGDLFDNELLSFTTQRFLLDAMRRLGAASIPAFYATGNHDPGDASRWAARLDWPANVHVFKSGTPEIVPIGDVGWLTAAGHSSARVEKNLAAHFRKAKTDRPHVAMLHTQVGGTRGADRHDRYAPCAISDLAQKKPGYDYWALGHVHTLQHVADDLPAWYAGNIQGRHPRETGPKGALYVEIESGVDPEPEFIPLAPVVWDALALDCPADAAGLDALTRAVLDDARANLDLDDGREHLVRLDLTGQSPLATELRQDENVRDLEEALQDGLGVAGLELRIRGVVRPVALDDYRQSATVLGTAIDLLERAQHDDTLLTALCPADLAGAPEDKLAYLRALLAGADADLAARLVPEDAR